MKNDCFFRLTDPRNFPESIVHQRSSYRKKIRQTLWFQKYKTRQRYTKVRWKCCYRQVLIGPFKSTLSKSNSQKIIIQKLSYRLLPFPLSFVLQFPLSSSYPLHQPLDFLKNNEKVSLATATINSVQTHQNDITKTVNTDLQSRVTTNFLSYKKK